MKEQKTNVMRLLEQKKIKYTPHEYPHGDDAVDGATGAAICGLYSARLCSPKYLCARYVHADSRLQRRQGRSQ